MTPLLELARAAQLLHAVEIIIPAEELVEFEIHEIADLLAAARYHWMHEQRGDTQ